MSYNLDEGGSDNHFNCPVVAYYPELLLANNPRLNNKNFVHPYLDLNIRKNVIKVLGQVLGKYNVKGKIPEAVDKAYEALEKYHNSVTRKAMEIIDQARAEGRKIIVIAGRPINITDYVEKYDAVIMAFLPGTEGEGIADVLFGDYDFTGTLPVTWIKNPENVNEKFSLPESEILFPYGFGLNKAGENLVRK